MPAAEPKYMPDVVKDTALARSCGGIHCHKDNARVQLMEH